MSTLTYNSAATCPRCSLSVLVKGAPIGNTNAAKDHGDAISPKGIFSHKPVNFPSGYIDSTPTTININTSSLIPSQSELSSHGIKLYQNGHGNFRDSPPEVVKFGNKYIITDGHHRAAAEILSGRKNLQVSVVGSLSTSENKSINLTSLLKATYKPTNAHNKFLAMIDKRTPILAAKIIAWMKVEAKRIAAQIVAQKTISLRHLLKAKKQSSSIDDIDLSKWDILAGIITDDTFEAFKQAYEDGLTVAGVSEADITDQVDERATAWAAQRAAELVGKRIDEDGNIIDNPDSTWAIDESTRDMLRSTVEQSIENGDSSEMLAQKIEDSAAFSDTRATTIARTELATAHMQGNINGWKDSGVVTGKRSILGSEHDIDDECDMAADDGVIGMDELFSNGYDAPPYHPNCVCDLEPVMQSADDGGDDLENMLKGAPIGNTNAAKDHVSDSEIAVNKFAHAGQEIAGEMSADEIATFSDYFDESSINITLRNKKGNVDKLSKFDKETIKNIDSVINRSEPLNESIVAYRGIRDSAGGLAAKLESGAMIQDPAYQSWTANKGTAKAFSSPEFAGSKSSIMMQTTFQKGSQNLNVNGDQQEIITHRNQYLKLDHKDANGVYHVKVYGND